MALLVWSIVSHAAGLTWVAMRSLILTIIMVMAASTLLAGLSVILLRSCPWWVGLVAVLLVLLEGIVMAVPLGIFRGLVSAALKLVKTLNIGRTLFANIFDYILGIREGDQVGERGRGFARQIERIPLGQANERLIAAVGKLTGDATGAGFIRRNVHSLLLAAVRQLTLARFRDEANQHGGIDLLKVRDELGPAVDGIANDYIKNQQRFWTLLVVVGLPVLTLVQTLLLYVLSPSVAVP